MAIVITKEKGVPRRLYGFGLDKPSAADLVDPIATDEGGTKAPLPPPAQYPEIVDGEVVAPSDAEVITEIAPAPRCTVWEDGLPPAEDDPAAVPLPAPEPSGWEDVWAKHRSWIGWVGVPLCVLIALRRETVPAMRLAALMGGGALFFVDGGLLSQLRERGMLNGLRVKRRARPYSGCGCGCNGAPGGCGS